ncbi:MAG: hypothetical protein PHI53_03135 [Candidatus Pacebacteria bacterium]|nr:hypothetical protein [Candidatus Paceibacterota bacterium]
MMNLLKKIQAQPEHIRRRILWTVVVVLGIILMLFYVNGVVRSLKELKEEVSFDMPEELSHKIEEIKSINIPDSAKSQIEEEIKRLEEMNDKEATPDAE